MRRGRREFTEASDPCSPAATRARRQKELALDVQRERHNIVNFLVSQSR